MPCRKHWHSVCGGDGGVCYGGCWVVVEAGVAYELVAGVVVVDVAGVAYELVAGVVASAGGGCTGIVLLVGSSRYHDLI